MAIPLEYKSPCSDNTVFPDFDETDGFTGKIPKKLRKNHAFQMLISRKVDHVFPEKSNGHTLWQ